ncbi:hypothetical protein GGX14DRAFT_379755 [Mycena pura]|uniref:DUF6533 domain-containing protein n=1 Tax=Mycena pura TaxID=153505 RepID=A0AAD6Y1Z7_9AGAR|nr:hypothetical protein GGX14DRAFT_379755 [Mycena pura]
MASSPINPQTPKAYLLPDIANEIQNCEYIYVGSLSAYIWDILCNLKNDYKLLSSYRFNVGMAAYFLSRHCVLWLSPHVNIQRNAFSVYPLDHCALHMVIDLVFYAVAIPANSLLFFLRGRAIFDRNRFLVTFMFTLWLGVLGTAITSPFGVKGANIGPTKYCITASGEPYVGASAILPLVHDTAVFLAISWRLFQNSHIYSINGIRENVKAFFTGEHLPRFSKAVMQDGQLYYLIALTANLVVVVMYYNTQVATTYSTMFTSCNVMLTNAMACHVYRNTKFGYHKRVVSTSELMTRDTQSVIIMHKSMPKQGEPGSVQNTDMTRSTKKAEMLVDAEATLK